MLNETMRLFGKHIFRQISFAVAALIALLATEAWGDCVVVFNEVMYHPAQTNEASFEWIELRNQLAVNVDISGWSIQNGVEYTFPEGSVIPGRGYLVVAGSPAELSAHAGIDNVLGPFSGRLSNGGEKLELINNNGRLMDELDYETEGDWPVAADGSGPSLSKMDEDDSSTDVSNWEASRWFGGTPGGENIPCVSVTLYPELVQLDSSWLYNTNGVAPGAGWNTLEYDASGWISGSGLFASSDVEGWSGETHSIDTLFNSGVNEFGQVLASGLSDPHYVLTDSAYSTPPPPDISATVMANHPAWLGNDTNSCWIGPQSSGSTGIPPGAYHYRTIFDLSDVDSETAQLALRVAVDDEMPNVLLNGVDLGISHSGFSAFSTFFNISDGFVDGTNTLDFYTVNNGTSNNPGGFRVEASGTANKSMPVNTRLDANYDTKYFRKTFVVDGDPEAAVLQLKTIQDDGAVFYLNGSEVFRLNMPDGDVNHSTCSISNVVHAQLTGPYPLATESLVAGTNVLAVEVHQASYGSGDIVFGAELTLSVTNNLQPDIPTLALNEIPSSEDTLFWCEIVNYGSESVDVSNCVLECSGFVVPEYVIPAQVVPPGGHIVIHQAEIGSGVDAGDRLVLYTPGKNAVVDAVVVKRYPRARWPEGNGPWLHPSALTCGATNAVALRDDIVINEIMYHSRNPQGANVSSPEQWVELYNSGAASVDLSGWRLEIDGRTAYRFSAGCSIASGGYLVVARDAAYLQGLYPSIDIVGDMDEHLSRSGARIELFDTAGAPLDPAVDPDVAGNPVDFVVYADSSPWPSLADGFGATLELCDPRSDNSSPASWAASDDSSKASWQSYSYRGTATAESASSPTLWKEFVLGLIGEGEILLDDISVVEDPDGTAVELLQNSDFEGGMDAWRIIGNHRHSEVITDPDNAANKVLRLVSEGYTGHMHNHAETTLANGAAVVNGREYQISYKAKWVSGCNRLLSRLYFNRLPQLTEISQPALCGTPGAQNSRYTSNRGPDFSNLSHSPVVPDASQSVDISVRASDPDGVSSATLHFAVNGGAWQTVATVMSAADDGGTMINATIPAQSSDAVVQFYVEAFDPLGMSSTAPSAGVDSRALYEVAGDASVNPNLHTVRIIMTPDDTGFLHSSTNVMSNERMGCTLITDERTVAYDCGLHLQGSERGRDKTSRVGFNVRLPSDKLYRGVLDSITVDRSGGVSGKGGTHDEILVKHVITKAGGLPGMYDDLCQIFAPRDQEDGTGLLILAKYSNEFLDSQYKDGGDGELFKLELIYYPTTTLTGDVEGPKLPYPDDVLSTDVKDLGDDPESYRWTYLKENRTDRNNYAPMVQLAKAFSLSGEALDARMDELMDEDEWMRALAVISLSGCSDTYTYGYSHNAIFYFRPEDGKAMLFPWDMDFAYYRSYDDPIIGTSSANTLKLINRPQNLHAYYGHLYDISSVTGNSEYIEEWAAHYSGLLGESWANAAAFLKDRADYVRSQLPIDVPFEITSHAGQDFGVTESPVTITGNGSVIVKSIKVNGIMYPVTWTSVTEWSITVPLQEYSNQLNLQAYDQRDALITGDADSIVVINYGDPAPRPVMINEWMADNSAPAGYPDSADQKFQDWFELYNPNNTSQDLTGFTLTDDPAVPAKWTIPSNTVLAANGFLLVWADGNPEQNSSVYTGEIHADFKLSAGGESIGLYSPEGVQQHLLTFGSQVENISQGFYPDGVTNMVYTMPDWTPGNSNRIGEPSSPEIATLTVQGVGSVTVMAQTEPGRTYVLEYKNNLEDPAWLPLSTNRASDTVTSFIHVDPGVSQCFYRVILLQ